VYLHILFCSDKQALRNAHSKFSEKHIPKLIEYYSEGRSQARFCADLDIARSTFYLWIDKYPSFKAAHLVALMKAEAYWLDKVEDNIGNSDFNFPAAKFILSNRFGVTSNRKQRTKWLNTKDLVGSFNKLLSLYKDDEFNADEVKDNVKILLDLASLKEREELEERMTAIEDALKEQNEPS
jgi:hypothetical protein